MAFHQVLLRTSIKNNCFSKIQDCPQEPMQLELAYVPIILAVKFHDYLQDNLFLVVCQYGSQCVYPCLSVLPQNSH